MSATEILVHTAVVVTAAGFADAGVAIAIFSANDDAPGGFLLGMLLVVGSAVLGVKGLIWARKEFREDW